MHTAQICKLFIKSVTGKTIIVDTVVSESAVDEVKRKIQEKVGIALFGGKMLENGHCLDDYNILQESTLHLKDRLTI